MQHHPHLWLKLLACSDLEGYNEQQVDCASSLQLQVMSLAVVSDNRQAG